MTFTYFKYVDVGQEPFLGPPPDRDRAERVESCVLLAQRATAVESALKIDTGNALGCATALAIRGLLSDGNIIRAVE